MKNFSTFQLVVIGLFLLFLIIGTLIFAGILPGFRPPAGGAAGELAVWGTVPETALRPIIDQFNKDYKDYFTLRYEEKASANFEREFVEAKADNRAPDLLFLPHELAFTQRARLAPLPPDFFSLRQFRDTFIDAGELLTDGAGVLALPLVVDPLVMYYNKNLLAEAGLPSPPRTWTEFKVKSLALTTLDSRRNITRSAAALGETKNIAQAKDLLAMLFLQAGNPIVGRTAAGGAYVSQLNQSFGAALKPAVAVLDFYTQFADPARPNYSWNRSLPEARQAFIRGQTVFYFGYASEYSTITRENPHLAFDVASVPQAEDNQPKLVLGRLLFLAAVRGGQRAAAAGQAAAAFAGPKFAGALAEALFLPPARRDLLGRAPASPASPNRGEPAGGPANPVMAIFYRAAILARAWPDPDPAATKKIFETMIESVVTGRLRSTEAVAEADRQLQALLDSIYGSN
ncbi:MAG: extracellular solute-binding protein [Candidatus Vogelbacteria bacterium]|nr:extracellular solute-binding protein [Candidatus Vogelbacteria bacterium]